MTLANIEEALVRNHPDELLHIPIALSLDPPESSHPGYAERVCRRLARHPDPTVRGNALLGFGHLARTVGVMERPEEVRALVCAGLADASDYVRGQAEAATMDLRHFLKWRIRRPKA